MSDRSESIPRHGAVPALLRSGKVGIRRNSYELTKRDRSSPPDDGRMRERVQAQKHAGNTSDTSRSLLLDYVPVEWLDLRTPMNEIAQFRPRRAGPEATIQDAVAQGIPNFLSSNTRPFWTAASLPVGAGIPDLIAASYAPQVFALAQLERSNPYLLAYLRAAGRARVETIAARIGVSIASASREVGELVAARVILSVSATAFVLSPVWREILPEIITIEVKVSNWKSAVRQAARNRIFSHRAFVALPAAVATRIRNEAIVRQLGLGLIAVSEDNTVTLLRKPRRKRPIVWAYYYLVASALAKSGN